MEHSLVVLGVLRIRGDSHPRKSSRVFIPLEGVRALGRCRWPTKCTCSGIPANAEERFLDDLGRFVLGLPLNPGFSTSIAPGPLGPPTKAVSCLVHAMARYARSQSGAIMPFIAPQPCDCEEVPCEVDAIDDSTSVPGLRRVPPRQSRTG